MRTGLRLALVTMLAVGALAACGDDSGDTTLASTTTTPPTNPADSGTTITVLNFRFEPATATIALGDTVTFAFAGGTHTSTARDGSWTSGAMSTGQSFAFTPAAAGTYEFFCEIHTSMTGTLTVTG